MVRVCFLIPFHSERMQLVLVLRSLDQEVGFHCCRYLQVRRLSLLQVVLGRLVDMAGCVEMFPFLFLYNQGGIEMVSDYFLCQGRKLVVRLLPLCVHGTLFQFEVTMVPCEWAKKDWQEC